MPSSARDGGGGRAVPEVVCIRHRGIRCAISSRHVLGAGSRSQSTSLVRLWNGHNHSAADDNGRILNIVTASGSHAIEGADVALASLSSEDIRPLTPVVRALVPLPHVVGLAELENELIWLVDTRRFTP
jgi:hypothetical protein